MMMASTSSPAPRGAEVIREEDEYSGVRVSMDAQLASASLPFHVDVNVGDPIWPAPSTVEVPRRRGGEPIVLAGYPIHMVHAEKIVTAVQRGVANTRWRDFGDIYTLSRRHPIAASDLREAIDAVAAHPRCAAFAAGPNPRWLRRPWPGAVDSLASAQQLRSPSRIVERGSRFRRELR